VPLRLLKNHLRDVEQRVGPARHLDLPREGFDAFVLRAQAEVNFRQGRRRFATLATAEVASVLPERPAATTIGPGRAALGTRGPAILAAGAVPIGAGPWSRRTIAARRSRATAVTVAATVGSLSFALVMGVFRGGRLLRPSGQEEFVQIKFAIR
jgi:hypothetical protein